MIVVSDTSCINYLAQVGLHRVLSALFGEVLIPEAVAAELSAGAAGHPSIALVLTEDWLKVVPLAEADRIEPAPDRIDAGEGEAIALAKKNGALLLIDDRAGRRFAESIGIDCVGTLGILALARRQGMTSPLKPIVETLIGRLGFRASAQVVKESLDSVGE